MKTPIETILIGSRKKNVNGQEVSLYPAEVVKCLPFMRTLPFTTFYTYTQCGYELLHGHRVEFFRILEELRPLSDAYKSGILGGKRLGFIINAPLKAGILDNYTEEQMRNILANLEDFAACLQPMGADLVIDSEPYGGVNVWHYGPDEHGNRRGTFFHDIHSLEVCRDRAHELGDSMIQAIRRGWDDCRVVSYFGNWVSDPSIPAEVFPWADKNNLWGSVFDGMVSGAKPGQVIDLGEIYSLRGALEYDYADSWRAEKYSGAVDHGWMIYNGNLGKKPALGKNGLEIPITPAVMADCIKHAAANSDGIIAVYSEGTNWMEGDVPEDEKFAVLDAINAVMDKPVVEVPVEPPRPDVVAELLAEIAKLKERSEDLHDTNAKLAGMIGAQQDDIKRFTERNTRIVKAWEYYQNKVNAAMVMAQTAQQDFSRVMGGGR